MFNVVLLELFAILLKKNYYSFLKEQHSEKCKTEIKSKDL